MATVIFLGINQILQRQRKRKARLLRQQLRDMCNPFEMPDREFLNLYRLSKETVIFVIGRIKGRLEEANIRSDAIPAELKVSTLLTSSR